MSGMLRAITKRKTAKESNHGYPMGPLHVVVAMRGVWDITDGSKHMLYQEEIPCQF